MFNFFLKSFRVLGSTKMGIVVNLFVTLLKYTLFNIWVILVISPIILLKLYMIKSLKKFDTNARLDGKTVIITGGNIGVGYETAKELSHKGARVILACRNVGSAHLAKASIIKETRNDEVVVKRVDLSNIWSVRQFVKEILEEEKRVDMLILNAAVGIVGNTKTNDDLQLSWQVNQFSSVLLVDLLLEKMKENGSGKIIYVNSSMHHFGKLKQFDVDKYETSNCPWKIHCKTRYANIHSANFLSKKLQGTGITVNTADPGFVNVPIYKRVKIELIRYIIKQIETNFGKDPIDGAATTLTVALDPKFKDANGEYFKNCKISKCKCRDLSNEIIGEKIWRLSEDALCLKNDERITKN